MHIELDAFRKWTFITLVCSAHSFFWGCLAGGSIAGMLAGVLTIIIAFSLIESHPCYKLTRKANSTFAYAIDMGVKLRLGFTAFIFITTALMLSGIGFCLQIFLKLFLLLYMGEIWIGILATKICFLLIGTSLDPEQQRGAVMHHDASELFLTTYLTTIITAAIHILILALLCSFIYFCTRARQRVKLMGM